MSQLLPSVWRIHANDVMSSIVTSSRSSLREEDRWLRRHGTGR
jgi:hypothetical protein